MAFYEDPKFASEELRKQGLVKWVNECRSFSEREHFTYRRALPQIYQLYRGVRTKQFHVHKNAYSIPLLYTIMWSHVARIVNMVFGTSPPIRFMGAGQTKEEAAIARKHDGLFEAQSRDARLLEKSLDILLNANLYGVTMLQHGWKYERGKIVAPSIEHLPLSETTVQSFVEREVVNYDGPDLQMIDNLDGFPQPGIKDIQNMRWFFRRYWLEKAQVEALTKAENTREPVFDPAEVSKMMRSSGGATDAFESLKAQRAAGMGMPDEETAKLREMYAKPVEIVECVGVHVPNGLVAEDGIDYRVISVANGRFLLRDKPFPLLLGRRPYLACSLNPDPHYFFAPGRGEMGAKLQLGINKITNQVLDALDVSIDPWFIFDRAAGIDPRNLFLRPGRWIPISGSPAERVMPGQPNLSGLNAGIEVTQLLWQYMQRMSGILDESVIGIRAPGRSTARGDLARSDAVAVRLVLEALLFERQVLEPLADAFMSHNKQFLSLPRQFLMLGDSAEVDPVSGQPIPQDRSIILPGDMMPNYAARANGTQQRMVRSGRVQDLMLLTQIIGQSPTLAAAAASAGWLRLIGREMGLGAEVNELIVDNPQFAQLLAQVGGNPNNIPDMNQKEGTPGAVGELNNAMSMLTGAA